MDTGPTLLAAVVLGIVEGLTEFIPVSSTGHLILASWFLGFEGPAAEMFQVVIQVGAIVAVCVLYFQRLWKALTGLVHDPAARRFALSVILAFLPAALLGLALDRARGAVPRPSRNRPLERAAGRRHPADG